MDAIAIAQKFHLKPFETILEKIPKENKRMSNKLNLSVVERYSKAYAAAVCDDFFVNNNNITGKQILSVTNVQQVNMLTVRALYDKWQSETLRVRSPFFDYENPAVQDALKVFMNTVSQHISVKREHFEPLLANATAESLVLILEPETFYRELIRDLPSFKLTKEAIAPLTKYIQVNKVMLPRLVERLNGQEFVPSNQAINWVDDISKQVEFERPEKYLPLFAEKVELPNNLLESKVEEPASPAPTNGSVSFFDQELAAFIEEQKNKTAAATERLQTIIAENKAEPLPVYQPPVVERKIEEPVYQPPIVEPVRVETPVVEIPKIEPIVIEKKVEPVIEKFIEKTTKELEELRLNEKLASEQKSLNDQASSSRSVLDMHQSSKIEGLASAISLNQRFLFTNNLFGGNIQAFSHALDELELCKDFGEAKELILKKYVPRYLWDITSAEAEEFIDIVKRRFN